MYHIESRINVPPGAKTVRRISFWNGSKTKSKQIAHDSAAMCYLSHFSMTQLSSEVCGKMKASSRADIT